MATEPSELADRLLQARRTVSPVDGLREPWLDLDLEVAERVGVSLLEQMGAVGSRFWKLGAVDSDTQDRLGVTSPVCAPLDPSGVAVDAERVTLDSSLMIEPKFEPEIGVFIHGDSLLALPCVEVADCRFTGWVLPPAGVLADAALQGRMIFGKPVRPCETVAVEVRHGGTVVTRAEGSWSDAVARLGLIPQQANCERVATGALTDLIPCTTGEWSFDFGDLGAIDVHVV